MDEDEGFIVQNPPPKPPLNHIYNCLNEEQKNNVIFLLFIKLTVKFYNRINEDKEIKKSIKIKESIKRL